MLPSFNSTVELVTDEVFARKDSFRSKIVSSGMSRRTPQFQSPIDMEDDVHNDSSKLSVQSEELKSVKE